MKDFRLRWLLLTAVVLCHFVTWVAPRHHFGYGTSGHRTRHRRQGAKLFLPGSYIVPKGEGYGPWGPWGDPSSCSRTCGGGVAYQTRICLEVTPDGDASCVGGDRKYFSCNTQDCPEGSMDFRSEQCAAYDNVPIQDITYNWVPYLNAPNPCELNCMPRGERFYFRHKSKVIDGTLCNNDDLDICVDGVCQHVGCDLMLGSNAKEDKCRVCRGNGTSCQTISGINTDELRLGYNDILWIPARATNIYVVEVRPSFNYLAVRSVVEGKYYLNGDYRPQNPQKFEFAGAVWYYERNPHGLAGPDSLRCQGPTTEPVYLSLLRTSDNVGVKYEYSVPNGTLPRPDQHYSWVYDDFTRCSASCGGGFQTRNVSCASNDDLSTVDEHLCDPAQRPQRNQSCAEVACPPRWVEGPWGPCSQPCGAGGSQSRQVHCEKVITQGLPSVVEDDECFRLIGPKPDVHRRCNEGSNCPQWHTGPWKPCDKLCGEGRQTRNVTCFTRRDGRVEKLSDSECAEQRPAAEQACMLHPCDGVDWVTSDWKGCDSCLSKVRTRTVHCTTVASERVPDRFCAHHKLPTLEEPCDNLPPCPTQWYASEWSKCNAQCGEGAQTRIVFCGKLDKDSNSVSVLAESECDKDSKYETSKPCTTDNKDCPAAWHMAPWSACTEKCGTGGMQYRRVMCLRGNSSADVAQCDAEHPPDKGRECNRKPCDLDETIPVTVGSTQIYDESDEETCEEDYDEYEEQNLDEDTTTTETTSETTTEQLGSTTTEAWDLISITDEQFMVSDAAWSSSTIEGSGEDFTTLSGTSSASTVEGSGGETVDTELRFGGENPEDNYNGNSGDPEQSGPTSSDVPPTESSLVSSTGSVFTGSSTDSSTDSSTTDITTPIDTTTDASTTDSSTTEVTTTDASTTDSTTDASTTDSTTEASTTDASTTDASTTELSTTDLTTELTTQEASTEGTTETSTQTESSSESSTTESSTESYSDTESTSSSGSTGTETTITEGTEATGETTESSTSGSTDSSSTETTFSTESSTEPSSTESSSETEPSTTETSPSWVTTIKMATKKLRKCRPRVPKCASTQFGCCWDNKTAAAGPFDASCPMPETCDKTRYGCCPDGVSPAGPARRGCPPSHCELTLFGCCRSDNYTAAQGDRQEGCPPPAPACRAAKYKCCKDGKTPAQGPKGKGCPENAPKPKDCKKSKFGCCHDNVTAATKPKGEGCPCNATQYGCCPDGTTPASGAQHRGCPTSCGTSRFGCCPDGETPAHGLLREGCCLNTAYGCCPDNINAARGPHYEGCDCQYSPYGCCPDNVTSAHGHELEGCGCQYAQFGCCPNGHDTASGPEFAGCGCHTHQFGCCEDGVTAATGPQQRGCRCADSQHGCCGDRKTPATGPDGEGCDCSNSQYGCCPDGRTEATGEKFLGCTDLVPSPQASCGLDKAQGVGANYSVRWFYDTVYGGCTRFWYYGSEGNDNRFNTQEECEQVCIKPPGKAVCKLPKIKGACESYSPRWYYDSEREMCGQFLYGGCLGNGNNFQSREECQQLCEEPRDADACAQPISSGECAGEFPRWGWDAARGGCVQFSWGGCGGSHNRFISEPACLQRCDAPGKLKEECRAPAPAADCGSKRPLWRFSTGENRCVPFYGCGLGANAFDSEYECQRRCPSVFVQDTCTLEPLVGDCYDYTSRWYYNVAEKRCAQFYWGGCGGNENNFASEEECEGRCAQRALTPVTPATPATQPPPFQQEWCGLPMVMGECQDSLMQWSYDAGARSCYQFTYSGCGGNQNRFNSRDECERQCSSYYQPEVPQATPTIDARFGAECRTPPATLLTACARGRPAWYYDERGGGCSYTTDPVCGDTGFYASEEACERQCGIFRQIDVCEYPLDPGTCRASIPKVYYDRETGRCLDFLYGGCGGGPNRFSSVEECESVCASDKRARTDLPDTNAIEDSCESERARCAALRCPVGVARRKLASGCEACACRNPCEELSCGDRERCAIAAARSHTGEPTYVAECRTVNKLGACPAAPLSEDPECVVSCNDDADCGGADKCCRTSSCTMQCVAPEAATSPVWYPPPRHTTPVYSYPEEPAPPRVDEEHTESETATEEGGLATLRCVFNGYPAPTITWQRGALTIDGTTGRYRVLTDGALQIVSVYRNDSGVYVCIGDNPHGQVRKEVTLQVRDPVEAAAGIVGEENASVIGTLHHSLLLRCSAYGHPQPEVYWFKGDTMLPFMSQYYEINREGLTIRALEADTLGEYTCQAFNGVGKSASWSVTVRAYRPPGDATYSPWLVDIEREAAPGWTPTRSSTTEEPAPVEPEYQPPSYDVPVTTSISTDTTRLAVGAELTLPCFVQGLPQPRVYWSKDDVPLQQSDRVHISDANRLTISQLSENDTGVYTCHASNGFSSHSSYVSITVEGVYVHPNCTDNPFFANCDLIVRAKYCTHHYYAKFCCRSCTLAGQLQPQDMFSAQPGFKTWNKK